MMLNHFSAHRLSEAKASWSSGGSFGCLSCLCCQEWAGRPVPLPAARPSLWLADGCSFHARQVQLLSCGDHLCRLHHFCVGRSVNCGTPLHLLTCCCCSRPRPRVVRIPSHLPLCVRLHMTCFCVADDGVVHGPCALQQQQHLLYTSTATPCHMHARVQAQPSSAAGKATHTLCGVWVGRAGSLVGVS
jgi:hypothetical protein